MHISSLKYGKLFFDNYLHGTDLVIVDIGSLNVNGTIKTALPDGHKYLGVDMMEGDNVDIVVDDPYILPFEDNTIDVIVSTSCFEHCEFFWVLFLEISRVLKPGGLFYLNAPSNGRFHRYPCDYWRFYPDSGSALQNWAKRNNYDIVLLESFIGNQTKNSNEKWNDYVAIFLKDKSYVDRYPKRIQTEFTDFTNGTLYNIPDIINFTPFPEDQKKYYEEVNK